MAKLNRKIILFTNEFPFGKSEQFLENELNYLNISCQKFIIAPLYKHRGQEMRSIPSNVIIWNGFIRKSKLSLIFSGLFNVSLLTPFIQIFQARSVKQFLKIIKASLICRSILSDGQLINETKTSIPTILYFYWGVDAAFIAPYIKAKRKIARFHGYDLYAERNNGFIPFQKIILHSLDYILPVSENGKSYLSRKYPNTAHKIFCARLGVPARTTARRSSDDVQRIVSCSRAVPLKRLDLIIKALSLLTEKIEWTHIGDGPQLDQLKSEATRLPGNIAYKFLGHLTNKDVINYYRQNPVDLFINVSSMEGVPVSIMEALSFDIPVIATAVGGTPEILKQDLLLQPDLNAQVLAEKIKDINKIRFPSNHFRDLWAKNCSAKKNYKSFIELYLI